MFTGYVVKVESDLGRGAGTVGHIRNGAIIKPDIHFFPNRDSNIVVSDCDHEMSLSNGHILKYVVESSFEVE